MTPLLGPVESPPKHSAAKHARFACLCGVKAALLIDSVVSVAAEAAEVAVRIHLRRSLNENTVHQGFDRKMQVPMMITNKHVQGDYKS